MGEAVAIRGYDPVSYFTRNAGQRGSVQYPHEWGGTTWFFVTAENRDAFAAAPQKYTPQFGGFCMVAMAFGKASRGDPDSWTIHEGKLYLAGDKRVLTDFKSKPAELIGKAEGWWPTLKSRIESQ